MFELLEQRRMLSGTGICNNSGVCLPVGQAIKARLHAGQHTQVSPVVKTAASAAATLSATEKAELTAIARDEKLARDIYSALFQQWGSAIFKNIAASEQQHLSAISTLMANYAVTNPVSSLPAGKFDDASVQSLFDQLLAKGKSSLKAALEVGVAIEELDITDLKSSIAHTTHSDIKNVYSNLLSGSQNHLAAFGTQLDRLEALV